MDLDILLIRLTHFLLLKRIVLIVLEELIDLVRKVEIAATKAISIGKSNLSKIENNTDKTENNDCQIDQLKNQISTLSE